MGEKPSEDILVTPRWGFLIFGDGYIAQMQGGIIETDSNTGKRKANLILNPEEKLRKRYEIKDSQLNRNGQLKWQCWWDDIIVLNQLDDANRVFLYTKTFTHDETDLSQRDKLLSKRVEELQRQLWTMEGDILWLNDQLQLAKQNPAEFVSQSMEIIEKFGGKMADIASMRRPKEGEGQKPQ